MTDAPAPQPKRRAATLFVVVTVVLDMMGVGLVIPVWPKLIQSVSGGGLDKTALLYGLFVGLYAAVQFLASPVQGALSDRFGRRPVILASNFGVGCNYVLLALAPNIAWLFAARLLQGTFSASISTAYAYLADVNPPEKRAGSYGLLGGAIGLGIAIGPMIGGFLSELGPRAPFVAAATLSLIIALYGLFVLPESLARHHRAEINWTRLNPIGALASLARDYPNLTWLGLGAVLLALANQVTATVAVLYTTYRYHWRPADIGLLIGATGFIALAVQGGLVRVVVARLGETVTRTSGLLLQAAAAVCLAFAPTGGFYWAACIAACLGGVASPTWQSMLSRQVGPKDQGRLAGASSGLSSLAGMIAPFLFTGLFAAAVRHQPPWLPIGVPYLLAAALGVSAALIALKAAKPPTPAVAADKAP